MRLSFQMIDQLVNCLWQQHVNLQKEDFTDIEQMIVVNFLWLTQEGTVCIRAGGWKHAILRNEIELERQAK